MKVGCLQVHRCVWCGDEVTVKPESLNIKKDISVICCECLGWMRNNGDVVLTRLNLERGRMIDKDLLE